MTKLRLSFVQVDLGIIVAWPSGVIYSNQANGVACEHPRLEGVFYPAAVDDSDDVSLPRQNSELAAFVLNHREGNRGPLNERIADFIDDFLSRTNLPFTAVVDRSRFHDSVEAWVWLTLTRGKKPWSSLFVEGFDAYPLAGVLVWENSD